MPKVISTDFYTVSLSSNFKGYFFKGLEWFITLDGPLPSLGGFCPHGNKVIFFFLKKPTPYMMGRNYKKKSWHLCFSSLKTLGYDQYSATAS